MDSWYISVVSYSAQVVEVMIASPSDVQKEREIVRNVIADWNAARAKTQRIILMPIGWETHSVPEMGDRPQAIINGQLVKDADLLVAVFWTRLGSHTGAWESGTVEEIEEHLKAGKPAMIYFSSVPTDPRQFDEAQFAGLQKFKESLRTRGLYEEFADQRVFRDKLTRQLAKKIENLSVQSPSSGSGRLPEGATAQPLGPVLSCSAEKLLVEASKDRNGQVIQYPTLEGLIVQTNGEDLVEKGNPRSDAAWRSAVQQLVERGFLEDRTGKGQGYFLTDAGYHAAESLQRQ